MFYSLSFDQGHFHNQQINQGPYDLAFRVIPDICFRKLALQTDDNYIDKEKECFG